MHPHIFCSMMQWNTMHSNRLIILQFATSSLLLFCVRYSVDSLSFLVCFYPAVLSSFQSLFIALAICMFTQMTHDGTRLSGGSVVGCVNVLWWFCVSCVLRIWIKNSFQTVKYFKHMDLLHDIVFFLWWRCHQQNKWIMLLFYYYIIQIFDHCISFNSIFYWIKVVIVRIGE